MRKYITLAALIVAASLLSEPACAGDRESQADVRCVIVAMNLAKAPGAAQQTAAMMTALYYLGRLDAHSPNRDLEDLIAKEVTKMTPADLRSEAVRCGNELTEKGKVLERIGNDLIQRGKAQSDKQATPPH